MKKRVCSILLISVILGFVVTAVLTFFLKDAVVNEERLQFSLLAPLPTVESFISSGDSFTSQMYYTYTLEEGDKLYLVGKLTYEDENSIQCITVYEKELDSSGYVDAEFTFPEFDTVSGEHPVNVDFYLISKNDTSKKTIEKAKRLKYTLIQADDLMYELDETIAKR